MILFYQILILFAAYLLGSVPSSVWIGRIFYGIDVREYGSGNAGATNTFRVLGKKAGIPVLFLDILKGYLSVQMAYILPVKQSAEGFVNFQIVLGIAALIGHIFPIYVGFRGGKGIATLLGILIAIAPDAALMSIAVFGTVFFLFRYVSLASIVAALAFPFIVIVILKIKFPTLIIFSLLIAIMVVITHQKNIHRLLRKEESKIKFQKKKKASDN
ncbi:MAG: glycerol-3-phosphate 1-O-acyltransferase PlsY [Bacteroidia bacterium]